MNEAEDSFDLRTLYLSRNLYINVLTKLENEREFILEISEDYRMRMNQLQGAKDQTDLERCRLTKEVRDVSKIEYFLAKPDHSMLSKQLVQVAALTTASVQKYFSCLIYRSLPF